MEEFELGDKEDYELVPLGPLRKMERRLQKIEESSDVSKGDRLVSDVIDILKSNQTIVNQLVESNVALRETVGELAGRVGDILDKMDEFMDLLKKASEITLEEDISKDVGDKVLSPVVGKMEEMTANLTKTNERIIESLQDMDRRMKKMYATEKLRKPRLRVHRSGAGALLEHEEGEE